MYGFGPSDGGEHGNPDNEMFLDMSNLSDNELLDIIFRDGRPQSDQERKAQEEVVERVDAILAWEDYEDSPRSVEAAWEENAAPTLHHYTEPPTPGYDAQGYPHNRK